MDIYVKFFTVLLIVLSLFEISFPLEGHCWNKDIDGTPALKLNAKQASTAGFLNRPIIGGRYQTGQNEKEFVSRCEQAIPRLEKALEETPEDPEAAGKLISCYMESGQNEKALIAAEKILPELSDEFMKHILIGTIAEIYHRLGKTREAIRHAEIALNYCKTAKISDFKGWTTCSADLRGQMTAQYQGMIKMLISTYDKNLKRYKRSLVE